jgi:hypothetical protein
VGLAPAAAVGLVGVAEAGRRENSDLECVIKGELQARTGKGIPGGRRWPQAARPQGLEGSGMAGPGETLGSPWIPLPVRA